MIILVAFDTMEALCNARSSTCMRQVSTRERKACPNGIAEAWVAATGEWMLPKNKGHIVCADPVANAAEQSRWHLGLPSLTPISEQVSGEWPLRNKGGPCDICGCRSGE